MTGLLGHHSTSAYTLFVQVSETTPFLQVYGRKITTLETCVFRTAKIFSKQLLFFH